MDTARFDILGIGNAIVDVVATAEDRFLSKHDMRKGGMALIGPDQAEALYAAMPPGQREQRRVGRQHLRHRRRARRPRRLSRQGRG